MIGPPQALNQTVMNNILVPIVLMACAATAMAQTNVVQPDKVEVVLTTVSNYLTGILAVVTARLGWWLNNKSKIAALVPGLVKAVESHGSVEQKKEIASQAGKLGIEPTMNAQVKALTPTTVPFIAESPKPVDKPTVIVDSLKAP